MPRTPTVTVEGTVEAIEESDTPVVSTGELADHFDVTRQAIRDQRKRLRNDPRIETGEIGNNTVFYLANTPLREMQDHRQEDTDAPSGGLTGGEGDRRSGGNGDWDDEQPTEQSGAEDESAGEETVGFVAGLASGAVLLRAGVVILIGYLHLIPAHFAAEYGLDTIALGLLILTAVFAVGGLLLMFAGIVAQLTMATRGTDTEARVPDGGEADV